MIGSLRASLAASTAKRCARACSVSTVTRCFTWQEHVTLGLGSPNVQNVQFHCIFNGQHLVYGASHRCYIWFLYCLLPTSQTQGFDDLDMGISGPSKAALERDKQMPDLAAHFVAKTILNNTDRGASTVLTELLKAAVTP